MLLCPVVLTVSRFLRLTAVVQLVQTQLGPQT